MGNVVIEFVKYVPIVKWRPMHGDMVHFNGWINRWIGVVSNVVGSEVNVIRAGTPVELFTYGTKEQNDNTVVLDSESMKRARAKYSVQRCENGQNIWFV